MTHVTYLYYVKNPVKMLENQWLHINRITDKAKYSLTRRNDEYIHHSLRSNSNYFCSKVTLRMKSCDP